MEAARNYMFKTPKETNRYIGVGINRETFCSLYVMSMELEYKDIVVVLRNELTGYPNVDIISHANAEYQFKKYLDDYDEELRNKKDQNIRIIGVDYCDKIPPDVVPLTLMKRHSL